MLSPRSNPIKDGKVIVNFRNAGNAPVLKNQKFKVKADARFATVIELLRTHLRRPDGSRLDSTDPLVRLPRHAYSDLCCARTCAFCLRMLRCVVDARLAQFLYCNSAFAPPPDELVSDVATCFSVRCGAGESGRVLRVRGGLQPGSPSSQL